MTAQAILRHTVVFATLAWPFVASAQPSCPGAGQALNWRTAETLHHEALKDPNIGHVLAVTEKSLASDGYQVVIVQAPGADDSASSSGNTISLILHKTSCDAPVVESDVGRLVVTFTKGEDGNLNFSGVAYDYLGRQPI